MLMIARLMVPAIVPTASVPSGSVGRLCRKLPILAVPIANNPSIPLPVHCSFEFVSHVQFSVGLWPLWPGGGLGSKIS